MNSFITFVFILLCFSGNALGQDAPFSRFEQAVREEPGGFAGNKEHLSRFFDQERIRLGTNFETELWKYLDDDADQHYWIASFLTWKSYLHGNAPLRELAYQININALKLLENRSDNRSLGRVATINRKLAVASKLAGKQDDAIRFRDNFERILKNHGNDLNAYIAGQTEFDKCVFENVTGSIENCDPNPPPKERIISAGLMNSRALNFNSPEYPDTVTGKRKPARVDVKILTDVNGSVIEAQVIRGPAELHAAAIDAAKKLKFPPTLLSGVPTKISGWVSFDFRP